MHNGSSYITAFGALLVVPHGTLENLLLTNIQLTTNMMITIKIIITQTIATTAPTGSECESESESSKVRIHKAFYDVKYIHIVAMFCTVKITYIAYTYAYGTYRTRMVCTV